MKAFSALLALSLLASPARSAGTHVLVTTLLNHGLPNTYYPVGTTPLDAPTTFKCENINGCTVEYDGAVDIQNTDTRWNFVFNIDGQQINTDPFPNIEQNPDLVQRGWPIKYITTVSFGTHTVNTSIYTSQLVFPFFVYDYYISYTIYRP